MARWVTYVLLLLCAIVGSTRAQAQGPVTATMEPARHDIALGESVTLTVSVKNNCVVTPPITFTATASFIGAGGKPIVTTDTLTLKVNGTVHVGQVKLTVPQPLAYVPNTALLSGKPLVVTASGGLLTVVLERDIAEQATSLFTIGVTRTR